METKKIMAMFAVLVIALSAVGFAYATWRYSIKITGEAHMGDFIVGWLDDDWFADDNEEWEHPTEPNKWVNDIYVEFEDPETSVHHTPEVTVYHTVKINLTHAYPHLAAWVLLQLKNAGTIPAHIKNVTVSGKDLVDGDDLIWIDEDGDPVSTVGWFNDTNAGPGGTPAAVINLNITKILYADDPDLMEWYFWWYEGEPTGPPLHNVTCNQIEPCTYDWVWIWLDIKQAAQQCHTYEFNVTICAAQWNWPILPD